MYRNYIKFAFRNFRSNKTVFAGSLLTLCLGTLCVALLLSYVPSELNMDGFHKRQKDIYMVAIKTTPQSLPKIFELQTFFKFNIEEYPEIESLVALQKYPKGELKFTYNNNTFSPEGLVADSTFFKVFDFELQSGNKKTLLTNPDDVVLTESFAATMFGDENPIGKTIEVKRKSGKNFTVKGILKNPPQNSSINFDFVVAPQYNDPNFFSRMGGSFILTSENFNKTAFEEKIKHIAREHIQFTESTLSIIPFDQKQVYRENLESVFIFSRKLDEKNLYAQLVIMFVILLISALNFSNLQLINTNTRIKDSALKRINGAQAKHLCAQLLVEAVILIGFSAIMVTLAFQLILPIFNSFIKLNYTPSIWKVLGNNLAILFLLVSIGLVYPLIVSLKSSILNGLKDKTFTKYKIVGKRTIVVFQYGLTILLLISAVVVAKQVNFMLDKDLGLKKDNIISASFFNRFRETSEEEQIKSIEAFQYFKNELAAHSSIKNAAQGRSPLKTSSMDWRRKDGDYKYETQSTLIVTPNYEKVLGLELLEGRFFDAKKDRQRGPRVVINEAAKKLWGISDISQSKLLHSSWNKDEGYEIIGVVKDFNYEHLAVTPRPLMMLYFQDNEDSFLIEFEEGATMSGLAFLKSIFKKQNPNEAFSYTFLSDDIAALYQKEKQMGINYVLFTLVALIISTIGLFTIALYDTQRRTKEIAVRKVNGAKVSEILSMLNTSFVKGVVIAFLISSPIGYYLMNRWLKDFAYKIDLSWWIFALAGIFTLLVALFTVSWHSYRAAIANPVKSLRTE